MPEQLLTKRRTIRVDHDGPFCISTPNCCEEVVPVGNHTCDNEHLSFQNTIVMTFSASGGQSAGTPLYLYELGNATTLCGDPVQEGILRYARAWTVGSFPLKYVGLFDHDEVTFGCPSLDWCEDFDCDFHVWAYSQTTIPAGSIQSGVDPPVRLPASIAACACSDYDFPYMYYDLTDGEFHITEATIPVGNEYDPCASPISGMQIPCDINILHFDGTGCDFQWISQALANACIGEAAPIPVGNGDLYAGLYVNGGVVAQYPFSARWVVYRQAFFILPQPRATDSDSDSLACCWPGVCLAHTYIVRFVYLNDGVSIKRGEPTIFPFSMSSIDINGGTSLVRNSSTHVSGPMAQCVDNWCSTNIDAYAGDFEVDITNA